jgi:AbiV family abortive infection protein
MTVSTDMPVDPRARQWLLVATACRQNAGDLLDDARLLLDNHRHARALSVAVLAIEEYGKTLAAYTVLLSAGDPARIADFDRMQAHHGEKLTAAGVWADIMRPGQPLDESLSDRMRDLVRQMNRRKMAGFYVDRSDASVTSPTAIEAAEARDYIEIASAYRANLDHLLPPIVSDEMLAAFWAAGPVVLAALDEQMDATADPGAVLDAWRHVMLQTEAQFPPALSEVEIRTRNHPTNHAATAQRRQRRNDAGASPR